MPVGYVNRAIERLSITFRSDGKREFVPRDQVSPLLVVYCSLFQPGAQHKLVASRNFLSIRIVLSCFYLPRAIMALVSTHFLFWEIRNLNLLFAVCRIRARCLNFAYFPGLGIDFRGGTYPRSTGTSNLVDVTTHFALLCQRSALSLKIFEIWQIWLPRRWRRKNLKKGLLLQLELYQSKWS